jgi:hypothetical protein
MFIILPFTDKVCWPLFYRYTHFLSLHFHLKCSFVLQIILGSKVSAPLQPLLPPISVHTGVHTHAHSSLISFVFWLLTPALTTGKPKQHLLQTNSLFLLLARRSRFLRRQLKLENRENHHSCCELSLLAQLLAARVSNICYSFPHRLSVWRAVQKGTDLPLVAISVKKDCGQRTGKKTFESLSTYESNQDNFASLQKASFFFF